MTLKTQHLLTAMHVVAWVAFIGFLIKTGAILFSYGVSIGNPQAAKDLYEGLNLYPLRQVDFWHYSGAVSLWVAVWGLEAYVAYMFIQILSRIKLTNPFTMEIAQQLERISHVLLGIWVISVLYNGHLSWLMKRMDGLQDTLVSGEFIFMAGVVFVIAQIFKRGVELQAENELTV